MREIKFRGKRIDNGEWVYGLPMYSVVDGILIIDTIQSCEDGCFYNIFVGSHDQYTGIEEDRNLTGEFVKKEIYGGDLIIEDGWEDIYYKVKFENGEFIGEKIGHHKGDIFTKRDHSLNWFSYPIIIGNISDNPELLTTP